MPDHPHPIDVLTKIQWQIHSEYTKIQNSDNPDPEWYGICEGLSIAQRVISSEIQRIREEEEHQHD